MSDPTAQSRGLSAAAYYFGGENNGAEMWFSTFANTDGGDHVLLLVQEPNGTWTHTREEGY